jgi:hypothetical protein
LTVLVPSWCFCLDDISEDNLWWTYLLFQLSPLGIDCSRRYNGKHTQLAGIHESLFLTKINMHIFTCNGLF